ncbi:MAG: hypothetical protein RL653_3509 [Pseudomonadota bacterium]
MRALSLTFALLAASPAAAQGVGRFIEAGGSGDAEPTFAGFDLGLTVFNSSGVYFGPEGYTNSFTLWLEPSYALGKRHLGGTWAEPLSLVLRLPLEFELLGNDARFRGTGVASSSLLSAPEQVPMRAATQPSAVPFGQVEGAARQPWLLSDAWLSLVHPKVLHLLGTDVGASLRLVLPTSAASRNATLVAAPSLGAFADWEFGPFTVGYALRGVKYLNVLASAPINGSTGTVVVNGKPEPTWRPESTGTPNPSWAIFHGLSAGWTLPHDLSLGLMYFLFHTAPEPLSGCGVPGVPLSNVCADGAALGDVRPGALHSDQWFLASVDWSPSFWSLSLGLSTDRPWLGEDGKPQQPFFAMDRSNGTTVYVSFHATAEGLAGALRSKGPTP